MHFMPWTALKVSVTVRSGTGVNVRHGGEMHWLSAVCASHVRSLDPALQAPSNIRRRPSALSFIGWTECVRSALSGFLLAGRRGHAGSFHPGALQGTAARIGWDSGHPVWSILCFSAVKGQATPLTRRGGREMLRISLSRQSAHRWR
jgi:hypothetical protein